VTVGFVGLGNMGSVLAGNLVAAGHEVVTHDVAGPARCPEGATFVDSLTALAEAAETVVLSLPDGAVCETVVRQLADAPGRRVRHVVDTSTIGVEAARAIDHLLHGHGIAYVDSPVSGGVAGARSRTLAVMYAAPDGACAGVEAVLAGLSDPRRRVGDRPGMAQALKLLNNFLSATALAATSEAIAFGQAVGLDMATMLDVLNTSSGRSSATADKFPNHVLTGSYAAGFSNTLMAKDLRLYAGAVEAVDAPSTVGELTAALWQRFAEEQPDADFTRIYPYIESTGG
jgi:3-hydroxyisobutyrate dehydrogenase